MLERLPAPSPAEDARAWGGAMVGPLRKAMYGLREALAIWHKVVRPFMGELGFKACATIPCMYYHPDRGLVVAGRAPQLHPPRQGRLGVRGEGARPKRSRDVPNPKTGMLGPTPAVVFKVEPEKRKSMSLATPTNTYVYRCASAMNELSEKQLKLLGSM